MNAEAILALVAKGLQLLPLLIQAGQEVATVISRLRDMAERGANGESVTDEELAALEAELDASIARFNEPME